jgi:hypothetical protein
VRVFGENAIERLQLRISISAYNTLLRYRRQAYLTQPLTKKVQKAGTEPLDRATTNTTHTSTIRTEDTRTNGSARPLISRRTSYENRSFCLSSQILQGLICVNTNHEAPSSSSLLFTFIILHPQQDYRYMT